MKRYLSIKSIVIPLTIMALLLAGFLLLPNQRNEQPESPSADQPSLQPARTQAAPQPTQEAQMKGNLMAWAESRADADKIATLYEITLVTYTNKLALFDTDKNVDQLIQTGKKNGWPELSKNNKVTIMEP